MSNKALHIDVEQVLRQRMPRYSRYIPRPLVRALARFIRQDEMNGLLDATEGLSDADFCRGVLEHLQVSYRVRNEENLPALDDSRVLFVSNHPLGGLDGMALIDMLTTRMGRKVYCVVNDLLLAVTPLSGVFLPINKHGRQNRADGSRLEEVFAGDSPILMFPAGMCSRRGSNGAIEDLQWQKMFVNHAVRHGRDVIPMHFSGCNSRFFYNFAAIRSRLGIKFNLEMTRLPAEVFLCRGKEFDITIGKRIAATSLRGGKEALGQAAQIKRIVYDELR